MLFARDIDSTWLSDIDNIFYLSKIEFRVLDTIPIFNMRLAALRV